MKTTEMLFAGAADIFDEYNRHPFVLGIQDGTLDREKFRYYIVQDCLYLEDYAKVFAVGTAKAQTLRIANLFAQYIPVMNGELDVHKGYLARLGVTEEEIASTPRALANLSYTSYMLRIAYEYGEAEILAAVLACAYSYEVIAKRIVAAYPEATCHEFYGDWVRSYISGEYSTHNAELIGILDELTAGYSENRQKKLAEIFRVSARYELGFWDMAWSNCRE